MIGEDIGPYTSPKLSLVYDGPLSREFVAALREELAEWSEINSVRERDDVLEALSADGPVELASGYDELEFSILVHHPGSGRRERLSEIMASALASDLEGATWFDFVVGLYQRSTKAGRRPLYTVVTPDSGRFVVPVFTDQSVLAGEVVAVGWITVFTPEQVTEFGRERLLSAPATRIDELEDGSIAVALTLGDGDEKQAVADHLGIEAPVGTDWFDDLHHEIDYVRHRAARRIKSKARNDAISVGPILDHLDASDPEVRFELTHALGQLDDGTIEPALLELARTDDEEAVRSMAVGVLGSGEVARDALWDPSARVQSRALSVLHECPDEETLDRVLELLESEDVSVLEEAADCVLSDSFFDSLSDQAMVEARQALAEQRDHRVERIHEDAKEAADWLESTDRTGSDTGGGIWRFLRIF